MNHKKEKNGFTLIEIIVVITIIAVLGLMISPMVSGYITNAKKSAADENAKNCYDTATTTWTLKHANSSSSLKLDKNCTIVIYNTEKSAIEFDGSSISSPTLAKWDDNLDDDIIGIYPKNKSGESTPYPESTDEKYFTFVDGCISSFDISGGTDVVIPQTINGELVTKIGDMAFDGLGLTSVVIPDSVTYIGDSAFGSKLDFDTWEMTKNNLKTVVIPDSVTYIGGSAFSGNQLTSIIIPDSVKEIDPYAFENNQLTSVVIGNSVTTIWGGAFSNNNLSTIIIPDSVTSIEMDAFYENNLTTVEINSDTLVNKYAFDDGVIVTRR
jgi:prepilin-type N-terminal cleavage/methylation domain-containing protein